MNAVVILVHRPEGADSGPILADDPFDGIEVFNVVEDEAHADVIVADERTKHPAWHWLIEPVTF